MMNENREVVNGKECSNVTEIPHETGVPTSYEHQQE